MSEPLPVFSYYPGAVQDGRIRRSEAVCGACERPRGWISDALLYAADVPDDARFCPWCIADGAAVERFGGSFNDLEDPSADSDAAMTLEERTPNFETWQDWSWPAHCGVPSIYRGQPSGDELRANPVAQEALLNELRDSDLARDQASLADFISGLGAGAVGYLFECAACGSAIVRWDAD